MTTSIHPKLTVAEHNRARKLRKHAVSIGIDPYVAAETPLADLAAVIRFAPKLRLVPDVDVLTFPIMGGVETTFHYPGDDAA